LEELARGKKIGRWRGDKMMMDAVCMCTNEVNGRGEAGGRGQSVVNEGGKKRKKGCRELLSKDRQ
jgi:hypothetical protein